MFLSVPLKNPWMLKLEQGQECISLTEPILVKTETAIPLCRRRHLGAGCADGISGVQVTFSITQKLCFSFGGVGAAIQIGPTELAWRWSAVIVIFVIERGYPLSGCVSKIWRSAPCLGFYLHWERITYTLRGRTRRHREGHYALACFVRGITGKRTHGLQQPWRHPRFGARAFCIFGIGHRRKRLAIAARQGITERDVGIDESCRRALKIDLVTITYCLSDVGGAGQCIAAAV